MLARTPRLALVGCVLLAVAACGVPVQTANAPAALGPVPVARDAGKPSSPALAFGAEHTFADGLTITVSTPKSFQPSASAYPHSDRAAAFAIQVSNAGSQPYRLSGLLVNASITGAEATQVVDSPQGFNGIVDAGKDLTPGRSVLLNLAFAVPAQPAELRLVLRPRASSSVAATYSGSA